VGAIAIVGGGARNALLCQLAADACERPVYAGPAEGTATGNILLQAVADRSLSGLAEIRAFVKLTGSPRMFAPRVTAVDWGARDAALTAVRAARLARTQASQGATLHV
jgi:rhamnulokinase